MGNIKLVIEYDGTSYVGWQIQHNGPSVQAELEKALSQIVQAAVPTVAAGRTDAWVHARGQVASCRIPEKTDAASLQKGLNGVLPSDIRILSAESVPDDFHARNSARGRIYRYYLQLRHTALARNYCWYVGGYKLDKNLLDKCASVLPGEHDFSSFCKSNSESTDFTCKVERATWTQNGTSLEFEICANRFLHGMVRALVGTMVEIARGNRPAGQFEEILAARDRARAGMSAPARGLFLEEVIY